MAIRFLEETSTFVLESRGATYAFALKEGALFSLYWGARLAHPEELPAPVLEGGYVLGDKYVNISQYGTEFTGWGGRFYSEPTLKVTFADGVRDLDLDYRCHVIEGNELRITMGDSHYDLTVELVYKLYEGVDIVDRHCVITNHTGETVRLLSIGSASLNFPRRDTPYRLTSLGGGWMQEYDLTRTPVTKAKTVLESRAGVSTTVNYPYFALDEGDATENSGKVWFGSYQWSGNWKITAEQDLLLKTRVTAAINDFDFDYPLYDGESFAAPVLTLGFSQLGFSGASRELHDYIRYHHYKGYWADKPLPILFNAWSTFKFDINEQNLLALAEKAAEVGVEMFLIDDGWFSTRRDELHGLGDWYPDPTRFPRGLRPIADRVHALGMLFGLWVEPEMVSPDTVLFKEHPDWLMGFPTRKTEMGRYQYFLNLAKTEVRDFIIEMLERLIEENGVDYLKWDMNRLMSQPGWPDAPEGEGQRLWVDYVKNLHLIFEHIATKYPKVILENCASGSLRNNLALTKWCPRANRSDNQDAVDMLYLHEGFTYVNLPQAAGGGGHISPDGSGKDERHCPMEFKAHAGMLGSLATCLDLRHLTTEGEDELKALLAYHKKIRHIVQLGDLYRLVSLRERDYMAVEYVTKDKSEALVFIFGPCRTFRALYPALPLYGLEKEALYLVDCDGEHPTRMHGDTLMRVGLPEGLHTVGTLQSKIIRLQKIG